MQQWAPRLVQTQSRIDSLSGSGVFNDPACGALGCPGRGKFVRDANASTKAFMQRAANAFGPQNAGMKKQLDAINSRMVQLRMTNLDLPSYGTSASTCPAGSPGGSAPAELCSLPDDMAATLGGMSTPTSFDFSGAPVAIDRQITTLNDRLDEYTGQKQQYDDSLTSMSQTMQQLNEKFTDLAEKCKRDDMIVVASERASLLADDASACASASATRAASICSESRLNELEGGLSDISRYLTGADGRAARREYNQSRDSLRQACGSPRSVGDYTNGTNLCHNSSDARFEAAVLRICGTGGEGYTGDSEGASASEAKNAIGARHAEVSKSGNVTFDGEKIYVACVAPCESCTNAPAASPPTTQPGAAPGAAPSGDVAQEGDNITPAPLAPAPGSGGGGTGGGGITIQVCNGGICHDRSGCTPMGPTRMDCNGYILESDGHGGYLPTTRVNNPSLVSEMASRDRARAVRDFERSTGLTPRAIRSSGYGNRCGREDGSDGVWHSEGTTAVCATLPEDRCLTRRGTLGSKTGKNGTCR